MKNFVCKCNKCGSYLIDMNHGNDAVEFELKGDELNIIHIDDGSGNEFFACPKCRTDEYLSDYLDGRYSIQVGDVVQFVLGENNMLNGKYGIVDEINGDMVVVHIPKKYGYVYGFEYYDKPRFTDEFKLSELKFVGDIVDFPELRADLTYSGYHHLTSYNYAFSDKNDCCVEGCKKKAVKRILYNCWGTVSEYDVCDKHKKYHLMCGDGISTKSVYRPVEMPERNLITYGK